MKLEVLGDMLRWLRSLKKLEYKHDHLFTMIDFHPQQFGSTLKNAAARLQEIYIEYGCPSRGDGTILGSFRLFTQLKDLYDRVAWLLGDAFSIRLIDILPPSHEELCLTTLERDRFHVSFFQVNYGQVVDQILELVVSKPSIMPNLRSIDVWIPQGTR